MADALGDGAASRVEHLTMRFGGLVAVNDVSLRAGRGDITAIIGPNGAGKTTVFNCITGFYKPTSGRLVLSHAGNSAPADVAALTQSGARFLRHRRQCAVPARADARFRNRGQGPRRAHVPEHPPVHRHDGAGKPARRPAQRADERLGLDGSRPVRCASAIRAPRTRRSIARAIGSTSSGSPPVPTTPRAICRMAISAGSRSCAP